ncbi:hypothetical protein [Roseivirga echinicomitans]|uniref:hypothetical protein n=1 Tax=Roseivirga echinicomitans TaxID=296218 RepID=UPI000A53E352|nr:hypothetical protein [Roseivirga echinicomitans]
MKEGLIKDAYEAIIKEIQTVITLCYLLTVGIGMLFNYQLYAEFGINVFDYSDVFDFLIAPFADFKILLFSVASIGISSILFQMDIVWKRKFPISYSKSSFGWDKKPWFNIYRYFAFGFLFISYLYFSADEYGKYASKQIKEQAPIEVRFADDEVKSGILIGNTANIMFLLSDEKVTAIPITSLVKEFEIK